jgi:hypothetical protein
MQKKNIFEDTFGILAMSLATVKLFNVLGGCSTHSSSNQVRIKGSLCECGIQKHKATPKGAVY